MRKIGVLFLVCLICFSLVIAQDAPDDSKKTDSVVDIDSLLEDFTKISSGGDNKELAGKLNDLVGKNRDNFFDQLKEKSGIDLAILSDGTFDDNGNLKLENGQVVDLKGLYDYGVKVKAGDDFSYGFRKKDFSNELPAIKDIKVEGDSLTYEFENGASIKLGDGVSFDFENRMIKIGEKGVEWVNMNGALEVDSKGIKTSIVYDKNEETDLRSFPILKDTNGEIVSPYHGGRGVKVNLPDGFKKPSKGKFNTFEKDGKTYSVDSDGGIREIKNLGVSINSDGEIVSVSNGFIDRGKPGEIFTSGETLIARGDTAPTDKSKSYVWFGEKDGKKAMSLNSVGSELFYVQKSDLGDVELNGNVVVKNGNYYLSSDENGNIGIRKVTAGEGEMEFAIDKLYTDKKKEDWFTIKKYEGETEELVGKLVVYDKDGKLSLGGIMALDVNFKPGGKSLEARWVANARAQLRGQGGSFGVSEGTVIHEAVHLLSSDLTQKFGLSGYMKPNADGSAAFYVWGEDKSVIMPTAGFSKSSLTSLIPEDVVSDSTFKTYFGRSYGERDALHVIEDYNAELHGFESDSPTLLKDMLVSSAALGMKMKSSGVSPERMKQFNSGYQFLTERASAKKIDLSKFRSSTDSKTVAIRDYLKSTYGSGWTQKYLGYS